MAKVPGKEERESRWEAGFLEEGQGGLCGMLGEEKGSSWGQDRAGARGIRSG